MNRSVPKPVPQVRPTKGDAVWFMGRVTAAQADTPRPQGAPQPGSPRPPALCLPSPQHHTLLVCDLGSHLQGRRGVRELRGREGGDKRGLGTGLPKREGVGTEPSGHMGDAAPQLSVSPGKRVTPGLGGCPSPSSLFSSPLT